MRRSLFPDDDALPTWLHTLACFFVTAFFGAPLIWWGGEAIYFRHLAPLAGPELGQYFFGSEALMGRAAIKAGCSLIAFGCFFFALAARYTRVGQNIAALRFIPWILIATSIALGLTVGRHG